MAKNKKEIKFYGDKLYELERQLQNADKTQQIELLSKMDSLCDEVLNRTNGFELMAEIDEYIQNKMK